MIQSGCVVYTKDIDSVKHFKLGKWGRPDSNGHRELSRQVLFPLSYGPTRLLLQAVRSIRPREISVK